MLLRLFLIDNQNTEQQVRRFALAAIFAIVLMFVLNSLGSPLKNSVAPLGIVSFEFAGSHNVALDMLASWSPSGRVHAALSLGLDYLFIVAYVLAIGMGCALVASFLGKGWRIISNLGLLLAQLQILAGLADAVENFALIRILLGTSQTWWAVIAHRSATIKFAIVGLGILYVLILGTIIVLKNAFQR